MSEDAIVEVEDLRKTFGGIVAVDGATFDLDRGEITGLIGPNGAGKTTTFNLLSGFYRPDSGEIRFKGRSLHEYMYPSAQERRVWALAAGGSFAAAGAWLAGTSDPTALVTAGGAVGGFAVGAGVYYGQQAFRERFLDERPSRPFALTKAGLSRTFQITRELGDMTVLENLMLGPPDQGGERLTTIWFAPGDVRRQETEIKDRAVEVLELLDLEHLANEFAGNLSGGQRKLLELGRVLMTDPEVILLDEPVAGVNPSLQNNLLDRILELRDEGYTFCVVEHDMDVIMTISDTVIVMDQGQVLVEGPPEIIREDERVIDAYLGGDE
ncbi:MAG: ABC transporter ATP-binding protein [Halobacteriales archaeon]